MRNISLSSTVGIFATTGFTVVGLGSCESVDYVEVFETEAPIERVVVLADIGDLTIIGADRDTVEVQRSVDGWKGGIALSSATEDGALYLEARCTGWMGCRVDTRLVVPRDAEIQVSLGDGEVVLVDLSGAVAVEVSTGLIIGEGLTADPIVATISRGDIQLQLDNAPLAVAATLGSGDLFLDLPARAVDAALDLAGGQASLDGLRLSGEARTRLDVFSAGGDVYLRGE